MSYDIVIVGGGPGGYAAALYGASAGLDVAMIEREKVGGTCLHRGCIPTKQLLETAKVRRTVEKARDFGVMAAVAEPGAGGPAVDWSVALARKASTVDALWKGLGGLLKKRKVTVVEGEGRLGPDRSVTVIGPAGEVERLDGRAVIVATGSAPRSIPGIDIDGERVLASDEALELDSVPERIAIVGGGAIGLEFASLFCDLGSQVTLVEVLDQLLPTVDRDVVAVLERSLKRRGVAIHLGAQVTRCVPSQVGTTASTIEFARADGSRETLEVDRVLMAVGRRPITESAGVGEAGVAIDERGYIEVDAETMSTSVGGIYAVGDVVPTPALAHVAFAEGMVAVRSILGEEPSPVDYAKVPWCIYSHPEVAFAGMSESAAETAFGAAELRVAKHRFGGVGRALIMGETEGMVKVIAKRGGSIVGVHIVGPMASELISPGYLALNWDATPEEVAAYTQAHPTLSEAFGEAAEALTGRSLHG